MKRNAIVLFAAAGVTGLVVGGNLWGLLGVCSLFIAVWAICENQRLREYHKELERAYLQRGIQKVRRPAPIRQRKLYPLPL